MEQYAIYQYDPTPERADPQGVVAPPGKVDPVALGVLAYTDAQTVRAIERELTGIATTGVPASGGDAPYRSPVLTEAYGVSIAYGARYVAPCSAWRSERLLLVDESLPRFVNRVHLYERRGPDDFGRYLGYLTVRHQAPRSRAEKANFLYVILAHLLPPAWALRPRYHLIQAYGGAEDGVRPFRSAPFCCPSPEKKLGPAACLFVALQQALLLKCATYGLTPLSSYDMRAKVLAWGGPEALEGGVTFNAIRDALSQDGGDDGSAYDGLLLETIETASSDPGEPREAAGQSAKGPLRWSLAQAEAYLEAHAVLMDYLANGLPVVAQYPKPSKPQAVAGETAGDHGGATHGMAEEAHAVMLFGMHLMQDPEDEPHDGLLKRYKERHLLDLSELPGRFVLHDYAAYPYCEVSARVLLDRCWLREDPLKPGPGDSINFLVVGPPGAKSGIAALRNAARRELLGLDLDEGFWNTYAESVGMVGARLPVKRQEADRRRLDVRIVSRILNADQVHGRYKLEDAGTLPLADFMSMVFPDAKGFWWAAEIRLRGYDQPADELAASRSDADSYDDSRRSGAKRDLPALVFLWPTEEHVLATEPVVLEFAGGSIERLGYWLRNAGAESRGPYAYAGVPHRQ